MKRILAIACLAALTSLSAGSAGASHTAYECFGFVGAGGSSSCTTSFPLGGARTLSVIGTTANYRSTLARGSLTLTWLDAKGDIVATYNCAGLGLGIDEGVTDRAGLNCTQNGDKALTYSPGTQTLLVTTTNFNCGPFEDACVFHGQLSIGQLGDLY